ncbi:flagellar basal body P-ring formation chaperone FlgA [Thalassotalea ganghwensis]
MSKLKIFKTFSIISLWFTAHALGQQYDSESVRQLAKSFVEKHISTPAYGKTVVTPADIDPRIVIKPCKTPLALNIPENRLSRNVNVKISCEDSTPWQFYLPVKVETQVPVLVANQPISKGSILDESNISLVYKDQFEVRGESFSDFDTVLGAKAQRTLSHDTPITPRNICVVCKGDTVEIVAKSDAFMIKTDGIAMRNANIGEQIRVKNARSGKMVTAVVETINKVIIN